MIRSFVLLALGLEPVIGQLCAGQVTCGGCTAMGGCAWNLGVCVQSSTLYSACVAPACVNIALNCAAASVSAYAPAYGAYAPAVYPTTGPFYTTPISTVLPPLSGSASVYAAPSIYASAAFPTVYPSTGFSASSTIYPSQLSYPSVSAPFYSSTLGATLPAASVYSTTALGAPIYSNLGTPVYSNLNGNVVYGGAPVYSNLNGNVYSNLNGNVYGTPVYSNLNGNVYSNLNGNVYGTPVYSNLNGNVVYGNGPYDNGFNSNFNANLGLGGGLLNYNGNPIDANIRNSFYANALAPIIPGIGGTVSTYNNLNLLANGGQTFDNILSGGGGRGNPLGNYVRNSYFANSLGSFAPGLSGPLNQLNQLNLWGSLLR